MQETASGIAKVVMATYLPSSFARILTVGESKSGGSTHKQVPRNFEFMEVAFAEGGGIDFSDGRFPGQEVADGHFDLVIAPLTFDHAKAFWRTFLAMCDKTRPGGHIYVSVPAGSGVNSHPLDYRRFYPDSGMAMERWAQAKGYEISLVESFVAERAPGEWSDFCMIFERGPAGNLSRDFVYQKVRSSNVMTWQSAELGNPSKNLEDVALLSKNRWHLLRDCVESSDLGGNLSAAHIEDGKSPTKIDIAYLREQEARLAAVQSDLRMTQSRLEESHDDVAQLSNLVAASQDRVAELKAENLWLRDAGTFLLEPGKWWWRFMPLTWQRTRRDRRLVARNLFDPKAYVARYPDVLASGQEPFRHYIRHGIAEHRQFR